MTDDENSVDSGGVFVIESNLTFQALGKFAIALRSLAENSSFSRH
jgi:hypothetical protein